MADQRKSLSMLMAAAKLAGTRPVLPFSADVDPGGMPCRITDVRETSATWVSLLDERKTDTVNTVNVLVDPADMEWRTAPKEPQMSTELAITEQKKTRRCSRCKETKPIDQFSPTSTYCRPCTTLMWEAKKAATHLAGEATRVEAEGVIPIKRSVKAKAGRRGKKRKYTKHVSSSTTSVPDVARHKNGRQNGRPALTFKELLADVKNLRIERDVLKAERDQLLAERSELYKQFQEVLAG